jgi:hypothetical protein
MVGRIGRHDGALHLAVEGVIESRALGGGEVLPVLHALPDDAKPGDAQGAVPGEAEERARVAQHTVVPVWIGEPSVGEGIDIEDRDRIGHVELRRANGLRSLCERSVTL